MIRPGLGTAQLGMPYGAYAESGALSKEVANSILSVAVERGISFLDTAPAYGESERRIGEFITEHPALEGVTVCTKIPRMAEAEWRDPARLRALIRSHLSQSEALLGAHTVRMVLLHQSDLPFLSSSSTSESMLELKADYPERRFGVSVYTLEEASCAIELPWVSAVQFPVNLVDRRFLNQHFISTCRERGIVRIARSLFLQGVLTSATPVPSVKKRELLERLRASLLSGMQCLSLEEAALRYIFGTCGDLLDIGLLGVHSVNELERNLSMLERVDSLPETVLDAIEEGRMIVERHHLFDPRAWNL